MTAFLKGTVVHDRSGFFLEIVPGKSAASYGSSAGIGVGDCVVVAGDILASGGDQSASLLASPGTNSIGAFRHIPESVFKKAGSGGGEFECAAVQAQGVIEKSRTDFPISELAFLSPLGRASFFRPKAQLDFAEKHGVHTSR